jgi:hypothetical protein
LVKPIPRHLGRTREKIGISVITIAGCSHLTIRREAGFYPRRSPKTVPIRIGIVHRQAFGTRHRILVDGLITILIDPIADLHRPRVDARILVIAVPTLCHIASRCLTRREGPRGPTLPIPVHIRVKILNRAGFRLFRTRSTCGQQ